MRQDTHQAANAGGAQGARTKPPAGLAEFPGADPAFFDTTRVSMRIPNDLYEAIGIAARVEGRTRAQLIIDLLTDSLSSLPRPQPEP